MTTTLLLFTSMSLLFSCEAFLVGMTNSTTAPVTSPSYPYLEAILIKERQVLQDYVLIMEQKLTLTDQEMERRLNSTEDTIANLVQSITNETAKRVQLQKDYDKLIVDFYDLNLEHAALSAKNKDLQIKNAEQEVKIHALEELVHNLTKTVGDINVTVVTPSQKPIPAPTSRPGIHVGFTADYPKAGQYSGNIRFSNVLTNYGDRYNSTTGIFTCDVPGLYYFSLVVYKSAYADIASCFIRKNNHNTIEAFSNPIPPADAGYFEASTSVVLHLAHGDTVDLAGCTAASTMEWLTSFSGFLVTAD